MSSQLWWVKLPTGEVFGPISTPSLHRLIEKAMISERDEISDDEGKTFRSITETEFYPLLQRGQSIGKKIEEKQIVQALEEEISQTIKTSTESQTEKTQADRYGTAQVSILKPKKSSKQSRPANDVRILELKKINFVKNINKDLLLKIGFGFIALIALIVMITPDSGMNSDEQIRLVAPKDFNRQMNAAQLEDQYQRALSEFETDSFEGYLNSMNHLIPAAESTTRNHDVMALLCQTYFELWPFSFKDSEDLAVVTRVTQMASKMDPVGLHGGTCRAVQQLVNGRLQEGEGIIDTLLAEHPGVSHLYLFKARVLALRAQFLTANFYAQKAEQLSPTWLRPISDASYFRFKSGQGQEAAQNLREIVKRYPNYARARLILGIIEMSTFRHPNLAIELINPSLTSARFENSLRAEGAFELSKAYYESQNPGQAKAWAKKAFAWDSSVPGLKDFLVSIAGKEALDNISKSDREHISLGDQYFLSGNYLSAQAHYKSAFEFNDQNSDAAFKAGLSLWKLNQAVDAIDWFKKAIKSNPSKTEAYVAMAEVYTARFDFFAASSILQKAHSSTPNHYEIYKGFANLAIKRNDFSGAIASAKKALALYDSDLGSNLLLARAYYGNGKLQEAYTYASHAIELDRSNPEAQSFYGELLYDVQGGEASIQFLNNLVNTYSKTPDYGVSLAKVLIREGRLENAFEVAQKTVSSNPQFKPALMVLGEIAQKLSKGEEALSSYLAAAALDPSDGTPLFKAGYVYLDNKEPQPAIAQFERVLVVNPNFPNVHYSIGKAALMMGDRARALKEATKEKKLNPNLADPYLLAGDIHMDLKQYTKATQEYQEALKVRSQGAEVYLRLAKAYRLMGQHDIALSMLRTAENKESGNPDVAKEFGAVYELKGDNMGAVKFYNRYLQILPNAPDRAALVDRIQQLGGSVE